MAVLGWIAAASVVACCTGLAFADRQRKKLYEKHKQDALKKIAEDCKLTMEQVVHVEEQIQQEKDNIRYKWGKKT